MSTCTKIEKIAFHARPGYRTDMQAAAETTTADPDELLSWDEIRARYPNEWVVLVDGVHGPAGLERARVYGHSPDRQAHRPFFRAAIEERRGAMSRWTGEAREPRWTWVRVFLRD